MYVCNAWAIGQDVVDMLRAHEPQDHMHVISKPTSEQTYKDRGARTGSPPRLEDLPVAICENPQGRVSPARHIYSIQLLS